MTFAHKAGQGRVYWGAAVLAAAALMHGAVCAAEPANTSRPKAIEAKPLHYDIPAWFKASFLDFGADVREAKAKGKQVMVFFHLDDCPFCAHLLTDNFTQGPRQALLNQRFDVVAVNVKGDLPAVWVDGFAGTEKELARKLGVYATPVVLVLNPKGEVSTKVQGYKPPAEFFKLLKLSDPAANPK